MGTHSLGFERTTCACRECVDCCKWQPGPLAPGDIERIVASRGLSGEAAATFIETKFWASPGALVLDLRTKTTRRVGSITPRFANGRCVFLGLDDRCEIHAVAPAGCALFDTHQSAETAQAIGSALIRAIEADPAYLEIRSLLPIATSYAPRSAI